MNTDTVVSVLNEIKLGADTALQTIGAVAPGTALEAGAAQLVVDELLKLASNALVAWSAASGVPITVESVQALLPNQTPLTEPDPA